MSTEYIREWPPLPDGIKHIQRVRALAFDDAWRELQPALYEGKVKARLAGARYHTFRHDGIEPSEWHRVSVYQDGSVEFARHPALPPPPAGLGLHRHQIEVCWGDVLRYWPEPNVLATKRPKPTATELDVWMKQHFTRGTKRDDAIKACHDQTGATFRCAAAAYKRLPDDLKLKRGQRTRPLKIEH